MITYKNQSNKKNLNQQNQLIIQNIPENIIYKTFNTDNSIKRNLMNNKT